MDHSPSPVSKRRSLSDSKNEDDRSSTLLGFLRNKEAKADLHGQPSVVSQDNG